MSPKYKLTKADLPAIAKAAAIGASLALVTWASTFVVEIDYGWLSPIVMGVAVPGLATLKRWLTEYSA
jgi:hypothetical protein